MQSRVPEVNAEIFEDDTDGLFPFLDAVTASEECAAGKTVSRLSRCAMPTA